MDNDHIDKELELLDTNEEDTKLVEEVEKEISNLSLAVSYYNKYIVNRPTDITIEHLYNMSNEYNNLIKLNSSYASIAYTAFDINLESHISLEVNFGKIASNVIEFLKNLIKWVITKINQMVKSFRNTRRKLINIIASLIKTNDDLLKELADIRNHDLKLFKAEVKYSKIKDLVEDYINQTPGFYIGTNTFEEIFNYNGDIDSINNPTRTIVLVLSDLLLEARAYLKRNSTEFDYLKLYENLLKVKLIKIRDSRFMLNAKSTLDDAKAIDKKAKDLFITSINKNMVTCGLLFKPSNESDEMVLVNDIVISSKAIREHKDPVSLDWIYRKLIAGFHNIDKDLVYNRDTVTDLIDSYNQTIELAESLLNSKAISNPEELKEMILFLNKNIFPLIFKGYMNQYLCLILSFNNRVKLIKLIIEKIKEEAEV